MSSGILVSQSSGFADFVWLRGGKTLRGTAKGLWCRRKAASFTLERRPTYQVNYLKKTEEGYMRTVVRDGIDQELENIRKISK
jgi:hypothetical protein